MALFGLEAAPGEACRQALAAARAIVDGIAAAERRTGRRDQQRRSMSRSASMSARPSSARWASARTMGVTAIGDTVNISSRLEAAAKEFNADMVISEAAAKLSGLDFSAAEQREIDIRGRARPLGVYVVRARHSDTRTGVAGTGGPAQAEPPEASWIELRPRGPGRASPCRVRCRRDPSAGPSSARSARRCRRGRRTAARPTAAGSGPARRSAPSRI